MAAISYINGKNKVVEAEFVRIDLVKADNTIEVVTFSNSYQNEVIGGATYIAYGSLVSVGTQQRDLKLTGFDTVISLAGVDPQNIYYILSDQYKLKGSKVRIYRGFYNEATMVFQGSSLRYTGVITSWNSTEEVDIEQLKGTITISVNCSNFKAALENRKSGRLTNPSSWKKFYPNDLAMDNVPSLQNIDFNFGKEVPKPAADPGTPEYGSQGGEGGGE